ncbi:MAG: ABC transporter permease [Candidatus Palauibacterales bacterium]|nr:ABC transporter permease [Candidatus Palauibacterales bacterium]
MTFLDTLRQDLRFAYRQIRRSPGFTASVILTLALGIGASVAMFTVVNAVLLRPLPYPHPDRLVELLPGENANIALATVVSESAPDIEAWTGLSGWTLTLTGAAEPVAIPTQMVDAGFFRVFGVQPLLGRAFRPADRNRDRSDVVILSWSLWQSRFGGDPSIVGRRLALDGNGHAFRTVVGVMPRGFHGPAALDGSDFQAWAPLDAPPGRTVATDSTWYVNTIVGRMRPGATVDGVATEVRATMERLHDRFPEVIDRDAVRAAGATGVLASMVGDVSRPLWTLLGAVGLVLLLLCANLANLLLARGEHRRRELAVRTALGAGRSRLVRDQLVESLVLSLAGCAVGIGLARLILAALRVTRISGLPRAGSLPLDPRVLAFAVGVSLACAVGFGLLPALRASSGAIRAGIGQGRRSEGSRSGRRLGRVLVAAEVALALVVVTGAGLLLGSLRALRSVDPGLDVHHVLDLRLEPPSHAYEGGGGGRARALYSELRARLGALPGVESVGAIQLLPLTDGNWAFPYLAEGHPPPQGAPLPSANFRVVTPGYFRTLGIPLVAGRLLGPDDREDGAPVGLVNATMARQLWPGESAIGKEIELFGSEPFRVVGVVGDVHQRSLREAPRPEMYRPLAQYPLAGMDVLLKTEGDPTALIGPMTRSVHDVAPDVPVARTRLMGDVLTDSLARERFFAGVLAFFALLALALGAVGVYGVMAYQVGGRQGEFGVRMALGATPGRILRRALGDGLLPVGAGIALGLAGTLVSSRLLSSLLYGLRPTDPATVTAAVVILASVAAAATWIPARRAARVDPMAVLREE